MNHRLTILDSRLARPGHPGRARRTVNQPSTITRRRAFSLPEVMFAIMILGIGFIMVAAMFPVAMQQAKDSHDDTTAAEVAKSAVATIQQQFSSSTLLADTTGLCRLSENATLWNSIRGSVIYGPDPRYAWTAIYRRDNGTTPYAQIYVFVLNNTGGQPFDPAVDAAAANTGTPPAYPNLFPRRVEIRQAGGTDASKFEIRDDTEAGPQYSTAIGTVAENAYLLLEDGTLFRLSSFDSSGTDNESKSIVTWVPYPGQSVPAAYFGTNRARAWVIGRHSSGGATPAFDGPAQDISVYTTFVKVN